MRLLAAFGDKRYAYMAAKARDEGIDAWTIGHEHSGALGAPPIDPAELAHVDVVIMPNPFANGLVQPNAEPKWALEPFLGALSLGTTLMLFGDGKVPFVVSERYPVIDLGQDEAFVRENAIMTAEGAVSAAMQKAPFSLWRASCLIIGFGRIGYALNELLTGLGAHVTVAARRDSARRQAVQRGANAVGLEELERILPMQQIVFSTPPEQLLLEPQLKLLKPDALIIDLASPPYGVDLDAARRLSIEAWLEPGLPGRFCPASAGHALLKAVQTALKCGGVVR